MNFKTDETFIFYLPENYFSDFEKEVKKTNPELAYINAYSTIDNILSVATEVLSIKEFIFNHTGSEIYKSLPGEGVILQFMINKEDEKEKLKFLVTHDFLISAALKVFAQLTKFSQEKAWPSSLVNSVNYPISSPDSYELLSEQFQYASLFALPSSREIISAHIETLFLNNSIVVKTKPSPPALKV